MIKRKTMIALITTGALAVVAAFGVFSYRSVYAQAVTPTPGAPSTTQPGQPGFGHGGRMEGRGGGVGYSQQDLATALGIDLTKLQAAYQSANTEALKQAVADGLLTQAQADAITARGLTNGPIGDLNHMFGLNAQTTSTIDYQALLAKALGISTDQLTAAYQKAFNTAVDNAVTAGNLTQAQADLIKGREALAANSAFQSSMQSAFQAAVKQAVTDGVISQAQADAILQAQQNQAGQGFGREFFGGPGFGGRGGHGFGGPKGGFNNNNNGSSPAPATTPQSNGA